MSARLDPPPPLPVIRFEAGACQILPGSLAEIVQVLGQTHYLSACTDPLSVDTDLIRPLVQWAARRVVSRPDRQLSVLICIAPLPTWRNGGAGR